MSAAEQPGKNDPKPQGESAGSPIEADVEKTLGQLEAMTTSLAQEVGAKPKAAVEAAEASTTVAGGAAVQTAAKESPTGQTQAQGGAAQGSAASETSAAVEAPAPAAAEGVSTRPAATANDIAPASAGGAADSPAAEGSEAAPPVANDTKDAQGTSIAKGPQAEPAVAAEEGSPASPAVSAATSGVQAEVDQEINQALRHLQGEQEAGASAADGQVPPPARAEKAKQPLLRRLGRVVLRAMDLLLTPVALVFHVLDLPVRWLPGIAKQLLGYVAIGTAVTAGALWAYVLLRQQQ